MKWTFLKEGFFPRHLPDSFSGQVVLSDAPPEVQGVWWFDPEILDYIFWVPGVGGDLKTLNGLKDYTVLVIGPCEWEFPTDSSYITLSKEELLPYLESGAVARDWWELPYRRELAKKIVSFFSVPIGPTPYLTNIPYVDPVTGASGNQWACKCGHSVSIRYAILDGRIKSPDVYYYRDGQWEPMRTTGLGLPFYAVGVMWSTGPNPEDCIGHWMCALKVGEDVSSLSSWLFFEYEDEEVLPGHQHMPIGAYVAVEEFTGFLPNGWLWTGDVVAEWNV